MSAPILPPTRPAYCRAKAARLLYGLEIYDAVVVLGFRGYYRDTMGEPGRNDRGIYDDAIVVTSPSVHASFNANTDPGAARPGIAVLEPGIWLYRPGTHNLSKPPDRRYPAFVQAAAVTVARDGRGKDTGWFGINIHRGGINATSSLGCQTVPPSQWDAFRELLCGELRRYGQKVFKYVLREEQG